MDALQVIPRRNNVSDAARAWGRLPALSAVFSWRFSSTVRLMSAGRKRRLTVESRRVASVKGRRRPLLSASVRQYGNNVT
jgi:hypothetical protein